MTKLIDTFGNDLTQLFYLDESGNYEQYRDMNGFYSDKLEKEPSKVYYSSPYLSFGDYDNSCDVERANVKVFLEMFEDNKYVNHNCGAYSSEQIMVNILCDNEEIIKVLTGLCEYPCINDESVSEMNSEMFSEDWECWLKSDFERIIFKKYDLLDINCEDSDLYTWFNELMEQSNTYYEVESGGNGYVDIDRFDLPEVAPEFLKAEYYNC